MFKQNAFKCHIIKTKVPENSRTTVYKCGDLIDLCRGPHVRNTGQVKSIKTIANSSTLWLGKQGNHSLQRVYGVSFQDKKIMKVWEENRRKAKERDHRVIGEKQKLVSGAALFFFFFLGFSHLASSGSPRTNKKFPYAGELNAFNVQI